jgi:hypothetical protein
MKCKKRLNKLFTILILGMVAFGFMFTGINDAFNPNKAHFTPTCESLRNNPSGILSVIDMRPCTPSISEQASNPLDRLFQVIFILFFISPPLIVVLLFLIWCELRKRNEHK